MLKKIIKKISFDKIWLFLSLYITISSLIYFIYRLDSLNLLLSALFSGLIVYFLSKKGGVIKQNFSQANQLIGQNSIKPSAGRIKLLFLLIFISGLLSAWVVLFLSGTTMAIVSPWEQIPTYFWGITIVSLFSGLLYLSKTKENIKSSLPFLITAYLFFFSIALFVYKIGYGFDPFIHEAGAKHIADQALILPKNIYYIGQYSLIIALNNLGLPIAIGNKFLVPILAASLLPYLAFTWLNKISQKNEQKKIAIPLAVLISLMLGFSPFILTTPQSLAYLFLIASIIYNLRERVWPFGLASALAAFFIHPIAGLPAIFFCLLIINRQYRLISKIRKNLWSWLILSIGLIILPLSLTLGGGGNWNLTWNNFSWPSLFWANQENLLLNFLYFWQKNSWLFLIILIILFLNKVKIYKKQALIRDSLKMALIMLLASGLSRFIEFKDLIIYEQGDYANRLLIIAFIFTLPAILILFLELADRIKQTEKTIKFLILFGLSLILSATLYLNYPRQDNYHNSRGYSLGESDLKSVNLIHGWAKDSYVVLANQQVGVAAMKTMGFDNYFDSPKGLLYFYSIPTGGPLYNLYWQAVYDYPSREIMLKAMDLTSNNEAFLVVNRYWWASDKIVAEAKLEADDWRKIDNGEVTIFRYLR